jgi:hypothetical protein
MKRPNKKDFERDSHGAFGEYETHFDSGGYAAALDEYINYLDEQYNKSAK